MPWRLRRSGVAAATVYLLIGRPRFTFSAVQLGGAAAYAGTVILFVMANKLTTAANAIFLQYTATIYVALFGAWFLHEHPTRLDWTLILVALGGIGLFFVDQLSLHGLWGNVCALGSGLAFATLILLLRRQKDASPVESVLLGNALTALICFPFVLGPMPNAKSWLGLLWLGVFQLGLAYVLYTKAIKYVRALESTLITRRAGAESDLGHALPRRDSHPWSRWALVLFAAAAEEFLRRGNVSR